MNEIIKKDESSALTKSRKGRSLLNDVALEIKEKYQSVKTVIDRLLQDIYVEDIVDDDGIFIRTKTHVPPQLIKWFRESRMFMGDLWKMSGGEVQQEGEKRLIEIQAKMVMNAVGEDPDLYAEKLEEWKKSRTFKEEE